MNHRSRTRMKQRDSTDSGTNECESWFNLGLVQSTRYASTNPTPVALFLPRIVVVYAPG